MVSDEIKKKEQTELRWLKDGYVIKPDAKGWTSRRGYTYYTYREVRRAPAKSAKILAQRARAAAPRRKALAQSASDLREAKKRAIASKSRLPRTVYEKIIKDFDSLLCAAKSPDTLVINARIKDIEYRGKTYSELEDEWMRLREDWPPLTDILGCSEPDQIVWRFHGEIKRFRPDDAEGAQAFIDDLRRAKCVVGHNLDFHLVVAAAALCPSLSQEFCDILQGEDIALICSMLSTTYICQIQFDDPWQDPYFGVDYKWPKLIELADVLDCRECLAPDDSIVQLCRCMDRLATMTDAELAELQQDD